MKLKYQPVTPVPEVKVEEKLGTTSESWVAPPSPWPIDARYLSDEQVAKLNQEQTGRANMWQQALMSSQGNLKQALYMFRAGYTKSEDLNKPLTPVWEEIFKAYGVTPEAGTNTSAWNTRGTTKPTNAAYDVRAQGYDKDNPYKTVDEK